MASRKQLIEHKLQYLQSPSAVGSNADRADVLTNKSALLKELAEITRTIEITVRDYEQTYGERFVLNNAAVAGAVNVAASAGRPSSSTPRNKSPTRPPGPELSAAAPEGLSSEAVSSGSAAAGAASIPPVFRPARGQNQRGFRG
jgi:hypothetical protein